MKRIGFLVNPIAGMGGRVGLKGTDGEEVLEEALRRGALPVSKLRALEAFEDLSRVDFEVLTCGGDMGESVLKEAGFSGFRVVFSPSKNTSAKDTVDACSVFLENRVDLVLFCGGDGTARDVFGVVGKAVPVLGIPAGVKMHSSVFAVNPRAAQRVVLDFFEGRCVVEESEVVDTDEEKYRSGELDVRLYGYALTPKAPALLQGCKSVYGGLSEERAKEAIASFAVEFMRDGSLYVLGPGSTVEKVSDLLGVEKSLLGVDLVKDGVLLAKDVGEREILEALEREEKAKVLVSPIGAQGFVFGRGNQQISARVIRAVGVENVIILATPHKLEETPVLFVDTGDLGLDRELSGERQVVAGYRVALRRRVEHFE
ncbi:MAG: ATP-NAD kinase family protein [Candidatus Hydrothermarchaeales archaeon]